MAVAQRLELRQGQSLVMTPQLQQAIKLLQLSNIELVAYVEQELERNPLLERAEGGEGEGNAEPREPDAAPERDSEAVIATDAKMSEGDVSADTSLDTDLSNVYGDDSRSELQGIQGLDSDLGSWSKVRGSGGSFEDSDVGLEDTLTRDRSLREHLMEQLQVAVKDDKLRLIGAYLVDLVDEAGYLRTDTDLIATRLGCTQEEIDSLLTVLQGFEPTGVFARTLSECLMLQLRERDRYDPAMAILVDNLELVARRDHAQLMRLCGVDAEDIQDMLADLRRCNPKPGLIFGSEPVQPVIPDVFVRVGPDGAWIVELNSDTLPRVLVNGRYLAQVSKSASREDKTYITECLNNANWLVKSLDQRARTILKVATEIVRQQDAFFAHGIQHLRPLNLRTIADAISMHESTVSRVTANKYLAASRGVFELKYFFTSSIAAVEGGEAHSAAAVRHRIKTLIDAETADNVLSDDRIVELLRQAGIDIARRTVAKYREAMRIPSSVQRRRLKSLSA